MVGGAGLMQIKEALANGAKLAADVVLELAFRGGGIKRRKLHNVSCQN